MCISALVTLLCTTLAASVAAQSPYPCEAPPEIRQALANLPDVQDFRISRERRLQALRTLAEMYPRDIFVQQRLQDTFRRSLHLSQEFDRAFALYRSKPDDPVFRYLEARLTGSFHPSKAEEMLNALIAWEPLFPWPHLAIAELTDRPGFRDARKAEPHLRAFLGACPENVLGYAMLRTADDPEMIRSGAEKFRTLLEAHRETFLPYWSYLWDLEFRVAPKSDQESMRQRVLKDVVALQKLPPAPTREWFSLFKYARDLTQEDGIRNWLEETVLKQFPGSLLALSVERERWSREHPRPARDAKPEELKAYQALERARIEDLRRRWPDDLRLLWDRWMALRFDSMVPVEEKLAFAGAFHTMIRNSPDYGISVPPFPTTLAEAYVKWQVRLDQIPKLIQLGQQEVELQNKYRPDPSMYPEEVRQQVGQREDAITVTRRRSHLALADTWLLEKKLNNAREVIQFGLADLEQGTVSGLRSELASRISASRRLEWLPRQARLAELEGNPQQALTLYQQYLQGVPKQYLGGEVPVGEMRDQIAAIKKLYLDSGGKEESWLEWATAGRKEEPLKPVSRGLEYPNRLADFEAKDLNGRSWRVADLKGKATFIDIWATWCGPCRAEHPELQKLYDKIKNRTDVQVLTFSMDENAYLAESYMKEKNYTFPAIASKELTERLFTVLGLPQGWVIDAQGRRSLPFRFFGLERTLAELEKAAAAK